MKTLWLAIILNFMLSVSAQNIVLENGDSLVLQYERNSFTGNHKSYVQFHNGIPVFGGRFDLHTNINGELIWKKDQTVKINSVSPFQNLNPNEYNWFRLNNEWVIAHWVVIGDELDTRVLLYNDEVIYTDHGKLFLSEPDTLVHGRVFLINPLNTAMVPYGSPYVDSSDGYVQQLVDQEKWVSFKVTLQEDTFWLRNDRFIFGEVSAPATPPLYSLTDSFDFTRDQDGFEDVNAFYHLTRYADHVEKRGYKNLLVDTLVIDAHGYNGSDLSSFNYMVNPVQLEFGTGGVDDAEDGEVVIHEFGHSLSFQASPNTVKGSERSAMEEGNADYFSTSYSRTFTDHAWQDVFNWDGHNEFWNGIRTGDPMNYPNDFKNSLNHDRELWSSPLMCLYDSIGQGVTDSLVMEHLFYQTTNTTMPEMAKIILKIDTLLFGGRHYYPVKECFVQYGILHWGAAVPVITPASQIKILNTTGFASGTGSLIVQSGDESELKVSVYDMTGQLLSEVNGYSKIEFSPDQFASGMYILNVQQNDVTLSWKVIRQ
ncbi:MAG: T9SS type A sorting domain-containing protein [Bacteroidetes bacterium]|nr:T9SS type A sorting domain-containing protein [Bacteroidota bacterium]